MYNELYDIYGDTDPEDEPIRLEHLSRMEYLSRVINETLRFFPPVPYIFRKVMCDLDIGLFQNFLSFTL